MYMDKLKKSKRYYKKIIRSTYSTSWTYNDSSKNIKTGKIKLVLGEDNNIYVYINKSIAIRLSYAVFRMTAWGCKE